MYLAILRVIASMLRREHEVEGGRVVSWCGSKRGAAVRGELRYTKRMTRALETAQSENALLRKRLADAELLL